jgi:enterochelin esterase-like enzyme
VGLTSPALLALLAVTTGALLAAVLWWWPRLAARGVRPVLTRIAALLALQVSVLGLLFVTVNRSAEFYASWSDLLGVPSGGGSVVAGRYDTGQDGSIQAAAPVTVTGRSAVPVPGRPRVPEGLLQTVRFHGQLSGLSVPGYVYVPPGYGGTSASARRLPVAVAISDQAAQAGATYSAGRLAATAARQMAAGKLPPLILVVLPAQIGQGDQGCVDVPGGPQAALFLSEDLPQAMTSAYPVLAPAARRWALIGDSSGGYCALQIAMTSSETFAAAAVPPAGYTGPPGGDVSGGSPEIRTQDNLAWLLGHQPMQPISVLFTGPGRAQPFLSQARPPMHAGQTGLATGKWPLARVLDWVGGTVSPHPAERS